MMGAMERKAVRAQRPEVKNPPAPPVLAASIHCGVVGEDGVAGRYFFPSLGHILAASAYVEGVLSGRTLVVEVEMAEPDGSSRTIPLTLGPKGATVELAMPVAAGTRLTLRAPVGTHGVWAGLLWHLGVGRGDGEE